MPQPLLNKNDLGLNQDNIVKDLQSILKNSTLANSLGVNTETLLEDLLMYVIDRDLKVFLHGHNVGATSARTNIDNGDNYSKLHTRSNNT